MEKITATRPVVSQVHRVHFLRTAWFRYAAAVILLFGTGTYLWFQYGNIGQHPSATAYQPEPMDTSPKHSGATLTLADGSVVLLDTLRNGAVANQSGTQILLNNNQLAYNAADAKEVSYNTIVTPKGQQFRVILPDGSKVWINAASSLRFPTAFTGKVRKVEITGEAFFEIAPKANQPFRVSLNPQTSIDVLGTSFNVNAYADEDAIHTTLLEGSVRLHSGNYLQTLKPGQQAQVQPDLPIQVVEVRGRKNMDEITAWKSGYFEFYYASIESIMRQLTRWYNVEVVYEGKVRNRFISTIPRDVPLTKVLEVLELTKAVRFKVEGKQVTVMPYK